MYRNSPSHRSGELSRAGTQSTLDNTHQGQITRIGAADHAAQNVATPSSAAQGGASASRSTGNSGDLPAEYSASPQRSDQADSQWAQQVFRAFDTDGRGLLDAPQLALALSSIGIRLPLDLVRAAMRAHAATDATTGGGSVQTGEHVDIAGFQVLAWRLARVGDLTAAASPGSRAPMLQSSPPPLTMPVHIPAPPLLPLPLRLGQERTGFEDAA